MTVMLDTCVVSDLRRGYRFPSLRDWMRSVPVDQIVIPAIVVAEIRRGIDKLRSAREASAAEDISAWLNHLLEAIATISFDAPAAATYADLAAVAHHDGTASFERDLMIAAIAATHGHILATRDIRHFGPMSEAFPRLVILNPYDGAETGRALIGMAAGGRR